MLYVGALTPEAVREDGADRLRDDDLMDLGRLIARHTQRRVQILENLPRGCRVTRYVSGAIVVYEADGWQHHDPVRVALALTPEAAQVDAEEAAEATCSPEEGLVLAALVELAALEGAEHDERARRARG